jgi:hypothetical protein
LTFVSPFQPGRVFGRPPNARFWALIFMLIAAAIALLVFNIVVSHDSQPISHPGLRLVVLAILLLGGYGATYVLRTGFELAPDTIVLQGALGVRRLRYDDIASYVASRDLRSEAFVLKLAARPGARGLTLWFTEAQVNEPGIARWIASMRNAGNETAAGPLNPPKPKKPMPLVFIVLFAIQMTIGIGLMAMLGRQYINGARLAFQGPPSVEVLHRTEGTLVERSPCRHPSKTPPFQKLTIVSEAQTTSTYIPCVISLGDFRGATTRHVVILTDERRFASGDVFEVDLDDHVLLPYASLAAEEKRNAMRDFLLASLWVVIFASTGIALTLNAVRKPDSP